MNRQELLAALRGVTPAERVITALDVPGLAEARQLADRLGPDAPLVKVGLELFSAAGPAVLEELHARGKRIFLDLKYNDIPNTVASAAKARASWMAVVSTGPWPMDTDTASPGYQGVPRTRRLHA